MTTQKTETGNKQAKAAAKAGVDVFEKTVEANKKTFEKATQASTDALTTGYEQAVAMAHEQLKSYFPAAAKSFDEFAKIGRTNLDAALKVSAAASKGMEAITKELTAFNTKAFETGMDRAAAFSGCKTLQDVVELQSEATRESFEAMMSQGTKISEISAKVPINVV